VKFIESADVLPKHVGCLSEKRKLLVDVTNEGPMRSLPVSNSPLHRFGLAVLRCLSTLNLPKPLDREDRLLQPVQTKGLRKPNPHHINASYHP
jgi:hypothetical protein